MPTPFELSAKHLPDLFALSSIAGWNQTVQDWQMMLDNGQGWGVAADDSEGTSGRVVASAIIQPYRPDRGWISMVLVDPAYRRRGLASLLMNQAIAALKAMQMTPWLDATDAGREVYSRLGFEDRWRFQRWARPSGVSKKPLVPGTIADNLAPMLVQDLPRIGALDAESFGAMRDPLLSHLFERSPRVARVWRDGGRITGFLLGRDGRLATQFGPLVASTPAAASQLLTNAVSNRSEATFIDLPDQHRDTFAWIEQAGFRPQRSFTRMTLPINGRGGNSPAPACLLAGPELG